jgi:hypothetical protein
MRDGESWHPDVIKLSLRHPDEVSVPNMLLNDSFATNLKRTSSASLL